MKKKLLYMNTIAKTEIDSFRSAYISELPKRRNQRLRKPTIIDTEISFDDSKVLLSITNPKGVITYCNKDLVDVCGYAEWEMAGMSHNIVRHPDMPRVIYKLMWQRIQNKNNIIVLIKNLAKSGKYYWVMTDFVIVENEKGEITSYKSYRKAVPKEAVETIIPLYKTLRKIEENNGILASEQYLITYLSERNTTYDEFIDGITNSGSSKKKQQSFFSKLFQ